MNGNEIYHITEEELCAFQVSIAHNLDPRFGEEYERFKYGKQTKETFYLEDIIRTCATKAVWNFLFQEGDKEITLIMAETLQVILKLDTKEEPLEKLEEIITRQLLDNTQSVMLIVEPT